MERDKIVDLRTGQLVPDITLNGAFQVPIFKLQDMHTAFIQGQQ